LWRVGWFDSSENLACWLVIYECSFPMVRIFFLNPPGFPGNPKSKNLTIFQENRFLRNCLCEKDVRKIDFDICLTNGIVYFHFRPILDFSDLWLLGVFWIFNMVIKHANVLIFDIQKFFLNPGMRKINGFYDYFIILNFQKKF
jgi:hypothetical protein